MRRVGAVMLHRGVCGVGVAAAALGVMVTPAAADTFADRDAEALAQRYAPIVLVQEQPEECSRDGEPYVPMPVDALLGNPQVAMRQIGRGDPVVMWAPTARDLHDLGRGFYLDVPGSSLDPGCTYERDGRRYMAGRSPTVYARVVSQPDRPGFLVLQYWIFWYFNDWNNTHEGDWEGIQLVFEASSPTDALALEPVSVGYAQHEGGQRVSWDSTALERSGTRVRVYPAAGSHASYFEPALHMGRGASEGFGCDDTTGPSRELRPQVVLLPGDVTSADDPFAWLAFDGLWGEPHRGPYSAPSGPTSQERWSRPMDWHDDLRSSSVVVPGVGSRSGGLADLFCDAVEFVSNRLTSVVRDPVTSLATAAVAVVVALWLVRRTSWTATPIAPFVSRRRFGQILRAAIDRFRTAPRQFVLMGLAALPVVAVAGGVAALLGRLPGLGPLVELTGQGGVSRLAMALVPSTIAGAVAYAFVCATVTAALAGVDRGESLSAVAALRHVVGGWRTLAGAVGVVGLVVLALGSTVVLAPVAVWLLVRLQFVPQVAVHEPSPGISGVLRRSSRVVRGRWWHTALCLGLVLAVAQLAAAGVALLALVALRPPFWAVSGLVVLLEVVLAPIAALAAAYLYGDAVAGEGASAGDAPAVLVPSVLGGGLELDHQLGEGQPGDADQ